MKVYIVGGGMLFVNMFEANGWEVVDALEDADLVQFTGGEDVSPYLYGEGKHATTYNSPRRDLVEAGYYQVAKLLNIPCAGVCRGGQFLNVMNGGKLFQNVNKHAIHGTHKAYYDTLDKVDIETVQVTSTHHQMMREGERGLCVLWAAEATKLETDNLVYEGKGRDVEAVYYGRTKTLCFQPHPEFVAYGHECQELYFTFLKRYLGLKV